MGAEFRAESRAVMYWYLRMLAATRKSSRKFWNCTSLKARRSQILHGGQGVFWRNVPIDDYIVHGTDIKTGVDCRTLPYQDETFDCVVFDPPYMEGFFRQVQRQLGGSGTHSAFRKAYSNGEVTENGGPKWHAAVLDLYLKGGREAARILKLNGICIVKCQDEVSANRQWLTHVEIINEYAKLNFYARDLS